MSDAVRIDLHVHSAYSPDSRLSLEEIVSRLSYGGLRGFALTDHNTVAGHRALGELAARYTAYLFLPGVEVSTEEGHLLAYGVAEAPPPRRPLAETVDWVRAHGGEAVPAHPFRWVHGVGRAVAERASVSALEVRNGHSAEIANLRAEEIAARRNIAGTGGSDAHEIDDLGRAYTEFASDLASRDDLLEAIRRQAIQPGGKSMPFAGRLRLAARSGLLRVGRGFRPI